MLALAGRCRRQVDVVDGDVRLVDLDFDGLKFDVGVAVEGDIDGGEGDRVVNEERHTAPTTTTLTIVSDEVVARDRRIVVGVELGLLDCGDADAVRIEEVP